MRNAAWCFIALAGLIHGNLAAQSLQVQSPVPFAEDNDISDAIKAECNIGEVLANSIKEHSATPVDLTSATPDTTAGSVLQVEIVDAVSMGNAFIGHQKFTKIRGALYREGEKVASFKARRNSMGGAFAGFKGSCSVLDRTVKVLGNDVADWLAAPKDGATLGD